MISSLRSLGTSTGSPSPQSATPSRWQAARDGYPAGAADDAADQRGEEQGGRPGEAACQPSHDEADQREPCGDAVQVVLQRPRPTGSRVRKPKAERMVVMTAMVQGKGIFSAER